MTCRVKSIVRLPVPGRNIVTRSTEMVLRLDISARMLDLSATFTDLFCEKHGKMVPVTHL